MPAKSEKQKKFMDAAAHNPAFAKQAGIPVSVAKEFSGASKGMKFGKGSDTSRPDLQKVNKPKTLHGKMSIMKEGGDTMATKKMNMGGYSSGGAMPMKDGKPAFIGDGKGMAKGGKTFDDDREPGSSGGTKGDRVGAPGGDDMIGSYKRGGMAKSDMKQDKSMMQKAVNKHEGRLHKGATMTKLAGGGSFRASANGIATKGKTKGTQIVMKRGGGAC